jgi:transposase
VTQKTQSTFVLTNPTEILQALVGLKDVRVLGYRRDGRDVALMIEQVTGPVVCPRCGKRAHVKDRPVVHYSDLTVYGVAMDLAWKKHRMKCVNPRCSKKTWVLSDHRIAAKGCLLTTRAAKWATFQVGTGRTVSDVASELSCDWHTVNDAVTTYGEALLKADRKRLNQTTAIGLDETAFVKLSHKVSKDFITTVSDVENHQIIDILPTREFIDVARWIDSQPKAWKERIRFGALDMSNVYAAVYTVTLPKADQVVDPYHAVSLANRSLDEIRRRVQTQQLGHRGRKDDPLYKARRILLMAEEKLDQEGSERLASLLELGDPNAEVAIAYRVKERLRDFYKAPDEAAARIILEDLKEHCLKKQMPREIQRLGRTIRRWFDKLCNYHIAKVTNGPTESLNNLIKRVKRIGFGFRNFRNYRVRALLNAGRPNWRVLGSIVVR